MIGLMIGLTIAANLLTLLQPALLAALLANLAGTASQAVPAGATGFNLNYLGTRVSHWLASRTQLDVLVLFGVLFVLASVLVAILNYLAESVAAWLRAHI